MNSTATNKRVLVTSGLPYSNGMLHVGHLAGAYLPADIYVRYLRLKGTDVRFICGSDDHGVAIAMAAEKEGKTPADLAAYFSEKQKEDFASMGISFDIFSSTSRNPYHKELSQHFFSKLNDKGYFEKQVTRQFYDESAQMFLPDRYVKGTCGYCGAVEQNADQCESCGKMLDLETLKDAKSARTGKPASIRETTHWFLDLSRFEKEVAAWMEKAQLRGTTRKFVEGLLSVGLVKRSMTRDLDWGIPLPLSEPDAKGKVLYVWFDAPIGYVSNTKELCIGKGESADSFKEWWGSEDCDIVHFIGEDNTIFHCIVWIAMLKAEGAFQLPKAVVVNQYLNFQKDGQEEKMSKSRGTAVWIGEYIKNGGDPDSLRYYLNAVAPENGRTAFSPTDLTQRHNSELGNTLGNLVHRVISFTHKYVGAFVPEYSPDVVNDVDKEFLKAIEDTHREVTEQIEAYRFKDAQETLFAFCRKGNVYFDKKAPWTSRKTDMEVTKATLAISLHAISFLSVALEPFLPFTAKKIRSFLHKDETSLSWDSAASAPKAGSVLGEPQILFAKIETEVKK